MVDRHMQRDGYVPLDAVRRVTGGRVVLTVPPGQVAAMGWADPRGGRRLAPTGSGEGQPGHA